MDIPPGGFCRARVAITLPGPPLDIPPGSHPPGDWTGMVIHLGHARTLILGELLAKHFGCPYHVRLDGCYDSLVDMGRSVLDLTECMRFLGVVPDKVYIVSGCINDDSYYAEHVGLWSPLWESLLRSGSLHSVQKAMLLDDFLCYAPSLILRGREFTAPEANLPPAIANGIRITLAQEDLFCNLTNQTKYQFPLPLISIAGNKLSKTSARVIHWTVLTSASSEEARRYLVATALRPDDPIGALSQKFKPDALNPRSHDWDWQTWGRFLREGRYA